MIMSLCFNLPPREFQPPCDRSDLICTISFNSQIARIVAITFNLFELYARLSHNSGTVIKWINFILIKDWIKIIPLSYSPFVFSLEAVSQSILEWHCEES